MGNPKDKKKSANVGKVMMKAPTWDREREKGPDWTQRVGEEWPMDKEAYYNAKVVAKMGEIMYDGQNNNG